MSNNLLPFDCDRTCPLYHERWCRFRPLLDRLGSVRVDSHTATVKVEYTDPEALKAAVLAMGGLWLGHGTHDLGDTQQTGWGFRLPMLKFDGWHHEEGASVKGYWYRPLVLTAEGQLAFDDYGERWGDTTQLPVLKAEYALAVVEQGALLQGWLCDRTADGGLRVYHPSGGTLEVARSGQIDMQGFQGVGCHEALMQLGVPLTDVTAKPEYASTIAQVQLGGQ